jgi:hypothetical protein
MTATAAISGITAADITTIPTGPTIRMTQATRIRRMITIAATPHTPIAATDPATGIAGVSTARGIVALTGAVIAAESLQQASL